MIDPVDPNQEQGQLDLGHALHPVQFRATIEEQRQQRAAELKFGRHGEGHAKHMYEVGLESRRKAAWNRVRGI